MEDIAKLKASYVKAQNAWNRDGGPLEKTVKAGEDLYFAGLFLVEALEEQLAAQLEQAQPGRREMGS